MTLRTLNYGNYGIFLIMGNAGFCPSTLLELRSPKNYVSRCFKALGFRDYGNYGISLLWVVGVYKGSIVGFYYIGALIIRTGFGGQ